MTDLDALSRAVLASPDDDTPRLIYADALEEAGQPARAAFVRAQVALARLPPYDPFAVRWEYIDRHRTFDPRWVYELPDLPEGLDWSRDPFRRGFPAAVTAGSAAAFVRGAEELFGVAPVESLELSAIRAVEPGPLARCKRLSHVARLVLTEGVGQATARGVLNSPHLGRLTELHIGGEMTSPQTAAAVVGSKAFRRLTALGYRDGPRGGVMAHQLATLADPPHLKKLDLAGNRLTAERVARLVAAPALAAVEELDLSGNNLGPAGARALAAARLPALRSLTLTQVRPEVAGVRALAGSELLAGLRGLALCDNNLGPGAATALAASPAAASLRVLDLRDNVVGDTGAKALANSRHLAGLLVLDLARNLVEDAGGAALAESPHLDGLVYLGLSGNVISPAAADRLRRRFGDRVAL